MVKVEQIILREIRLPLVEPFRTSSGTVSDRRIFLVEVVDATGAIGWGECVAQETPGYSPETIETCWLMIRENVAPRVLGRAFAEPGEVHAALEEDFRGHNMAKAAVEMAIWDLESTLQGVPLATLIGGTREKIGTGISIGIQPDPGTVARKAVAALEEGYCRVKMKISPGADVDYVRAVREAVGPEGRVMVDANSAYTMDDLDTLRQLDEFGLMMIEQPLAWDDVYRHAALQKELKTPICLDESITDLRKVEDMIALGSGKIVNIKPGRVGGFAAAKAIHDVCEANEIPVWCGGMLESGVGRAHNVALASLPNFRLPGDVSPSARYWEQDIVYPQWEMDGDGYVGVPLERPGMGVEVDRERVEFLCARKEVLKS